MSYIEENPITDELLSEQDNLLLCFPVSTAEGDTAFKVNAFRIGTSNYLFKEIDNLPTLKPRGEDGSILEIGRLGTHGHQNDETIDDPGDSIFRIRSDRPLYIYHFGLGLKPDGVRLYLENPAGDLVDGLQYDVRAKSDDNFGFYPSEMMGYMPPSKIAEQFKIHDITIHLGLRNNRSQSIKPLMSLVGKSYELMPIKNKNMIEEFIMRKRPVTIKTFGSMITSGVSLPTKWPESVRITDDWLNDKIKEAIR